MNKFDLKTAKFVGIILFMCLIFALVVMKAYQYLPEENITQNFQEEISNEKIQYENFENKKDNQEEDLEEETSVTNNNTEERTIEDRRPIRELENLDNPKNQNIENSALENADNFKQNGNYKEAVEQYKEVASEADAKTKAYCFEQIATIHAIEKHYGTALSFAQKAYNTYPNTQREILLARLYYKTGNIEKATNRVNNILKRDFDQDK